MIVLRREKRFYVMVCGIVCAFCLYYWILQNIQTIEPPRPDSRPDNGELVEEGEDLDVDVSIGEEETDSSDPTIDMEELARRREGLEQTKQEYRNQRDRLLRRLDTLSSSLEEAKASEQEMLDAWNALDCQDQSDSGFTETMAEDFMSIRERESLLADNATAMAERHSLLTRLLQGIAGQDIGASLDELSKRIDELETSVDEYARECLEITRQSQRLAERAQGSDRGGSLHDLLCQMETVKVVPDLQQLVDQQESEIVNECDDYFDQMVAQTKRDAETRAQQRRAKNEQEARIIQQQADDALAAHESQQQGLDDEIEAQQRAVAFDRDRAKIEYYLVPFIALKRAYTTPAVLDDKIKDFYWVNIPLGQAASLSDIQASGAFESGADSFRRLERFTSSRIQMLDEQYLPFGQHWSSKNEDYLLLARELLMKHGQAMVEAGLLRP
jgi:hypothetical protein